MKQLTNDSLYNLSLGAALLGSGGGGDVMMLQDYLGYLIDNNGPVSIVSINEVDSNAIIVPIAMMGAPMIAIERIFNANMLMQLYLKIRAHFHDQPIILMPAEIGGCNALTPFVLASLCQIPVLDADLIGRAFPKINMSKPAINNVQQSETFIASAMGEVVHFRTKTVADLEAKARDAAIRFGCSAALATFIFEAQHYQDYIITNSVSRAISLGDLLAKRDLDYTTIFKIMGSGVIMDVHHRIEGGFLNGYVVIENKNSHYKIFFQNEYLVVVKNGRVISETPAIISLIETRSKRPISSESLRFGLHVDIVELNPPEFWTQPGAKGEVDLKMFGYDVFKLENSYV